MRSLSSPTMGSSHGVGLYLILVLVFVCEASEDPEPHHHQMEIVYDTDGLQREMTREEMKYLMLQRPINHDISSLMKMRVSGSSGIDMSQTVNTNFHPEDNPSGPALFGLRSMGPSKGPEIHFPPAFPSSSNLEDICQFSKASVRYPKDIFTAKRFGREYEHARVVNRLQRWYGVCCGIDGSEAEKICCAKQAWRKTLSEFCFEESTVKTTAFSPYLCCEKKGKARWKCFDKEAPATSYDIPILDFNVDIPRTVKDFKFNPSSCKG